MATESSSSSSSSSADETDGEGLYDGWDMDILQAEPFESSEPSPPPMMILDDDLGLAYWDVGEPYPVPPSPPPPPLVFDQSDELAYETLRRASKKGAGMPGRRPSRRRTRGGEPRYSPPKQLLRCNHDPAVHKAVVRNFVRDRLMRIRRQRWRVVPARRVRVLYWFGLAYTSPAGGWPTLAEFDASIAYLPETVRSKYRAFVMTTPGGHAVQPLTFHLLSHHGCALCDCPDARVERVDISADAAQPGNLLPMCASCSATSYCRRQRPIAPPQ